MLASIWRICAADEATPPRNWATVDSPRRLSICPSTWPRLTFSPSFTESERSSPVTFELTLTVSRACRWPAALTVRVTSCFLTIAVVTSVAGGGCGSRPCTVAKPTARRMRTARIQRPIVIVSSSENFEDGYPLIATFVRRR
jgi:hypothetical protein